MGGGWGPNNSFYKVKNHKYVFLGVISIICIPPIGRKLFCAANIIVPLLKYPFLGKDRFLYERKHNITA